MPLQYGVMHRVACGVDVHRDGFVATILSCKGFETRIFVKSLEDIEDSKLS